MIDRTTVERIKNAANIVEVVSEFVTLRRAGANYKGLCPFHNEKTPSFIVSPARGTCHCFGCGRGGNAVSFIMEHEQQTYPEALRWLAAKYGIEVVEKELTDKERQEQSQREAMYIINEWARQYFEDTLHTHADGQAIGMQYLRGRGFRDDIIAAYHLGFSLRDRHALPQQARKEGYKEDYLLLTGLCYKTDRGELLDRFADRVVFPWIGLNGKVVGFSARLLDSRTKGVQQKYVNSPDSEVYHKDRELFGIFQAKKSIARDDRVYIVEGQTDVLSMAQTGIENVVANSGTALSTHQIHILHRFTDNITLLYDNDAAGIHAAMRGTDMLLAEGMNVKVLLLPEGEDPDSFARKHSAEEFREYVESHQMDFIQFKTRHLLAHASDPQQRTEAIDSIVRSIAGVPNQVLRDTYLHDAAAAVGIKEATLINRMNTFIRERLPRTTAPIASVPAATATPVQQVERMLAQLVVRYGEQLVLRSVADEHGQPTDVSLAQYICEMLHAEGLLLTDPHYQTILDRAAQIALSGGIVEQTLVDDDDLELSRVALDLATDKYSTVPMYATPTNDTIVDEEYGKEKLRDRLRSEAEHLIADYRTHCAEEKLAAVKAQLTNSALSNDEKKTLLEEYKRLLEECNRVADPRRHKDDEQQAGAYRKILRFTLP